MRGSRTRVAGVLVAASMLAAAVVIAASRQHHVPAGAPTDPAVAKTNVTVLPAARLSAPVLQAASLSPANLDELLALPPEQLASVDIALSNLLCASDLPGSEHAQHGFITTQIDRWAMLVATETTRHAYRVTDPRYAQHYRHSYAYLCAEMMLQTLQEDCGVRYNADRVRDPDFSDSRDQFLHGLVGRSPIEIRGGTCVSMPVLYAAVGRRLGYPIKLVQGSGHLFCRWDDADSGWAKANGLPRGERFNIEGTDGFSAYPDEFYEQFPRPIDHAAVDRGELLKSLTPAEELAVFLAARGHCFFDNRRFDEAIEAYEHAARLMPQAAIWPWFAARTRDTQAMIKEHQLAKRMREQERRSAVGRPIVSHPIEQQRNPRHK